MNIKNPFFGYNQNIYSIVINYNQHYRQIYLLDNIPTHLSETTPKYT